MRTSEQGFTRWYLGPEAMEDRLRSHVNFDNSNLDGTSLLVIITCLLHTFDERRKLADAICDVKEKFYAMRQGQHMSLQKYHEHFNALAQVLKEVGVNIADEALIDSIATENGRAGAPEDANQKKAKQQALAVRFIRGTNSKHSGYLTHLRNSYLNGQDNYPETLYRAYHVLQRREGNDNAFQLKSDCQVSKSVGATLENTGRMDCGSLCDTIQSTIR